MTDSAKLRVKLSAPLEVQGVGKVSVLELRARMTVGDLIAAERAGLDGIEKDLFVVARLAGYTAQDLEGLSTEDFEDALKAVGEAKKARVAAKNPPNPAPSSTP